MSCNFRYVQAQCSINQCVYRQTASEMTVSEIIKFITDHFSFKVKVTACLSSLSLLKFTELN